MTLVNYDLKEGVATLTLSNPPANAYSTRMFEEMDAAILDARRNKQVEVIVVTGAGEKFFCAGADIGMLAEADPEEKYYFCLHANETLLRLENTPKLVIAALNGHCVGGGLEVALAADLRVALTTFSGKIGLPEVGLGVLPGTGGTQRLARLLGKSHAIELMAEGTLLTAEEAKEKGLVNRLLEGDNFQAVVHEYARSFCNPVKSSRAIGHIKRAVSGGIDLPLESGLALERELQQRLFTGPDAAEGISAFNVGRKPQFGNQVETGAAAPHSS
ncbi:enoyl-CoA hydratase/isomerase family protein [Marinobacter sp.]|uniref:enoyl-CoA hydratase/isomerase family protein n=1 Tax=Marinobacter sp. TaxID=50741 RepID=UPI00384ACFE0